jgi:hypothetical protein
MTTYTSRVLGALPRFPRALAFLGWFTFRTSTLRPPRHPSSIVPRPSVRLRSARYFPLPRSFGQALCSDMRISSSPICQACPPSPGLPVISLTLGFYNQHGPSGGSSITARPKLALYMYASKASASSTSPYLNPPLPQGNGCCPGPVESHWDARH